MRRTLFTTWTTATLTVLALLWNTPGFEGREEKDRAARIFAIIVIILDTGKVYAGRTSARKKIAGESATAVEPLATLSVTAKHRDPDLARRNLLRKTNPQPVIEVPTQATITQSTT